jgi:Leucine-rich repeat (LRR) protein
LINNKIDTDGIINGQMNYDDTKGITTLFISNLNIKNLKGIEAFIDLKTLHCYNNQLTNLNINKNSELEILHCEYNQLTNLNINKNINLIDLRCSNNQLINLDVNKNSKLKILYCPNNQLTNLDISKNSNLKDLWCTNNKIKTICVTDVNKAKANPSFQKDVSAEYKICE